MIALVDDRPLALSVGFKATDWSKPVDQKLYEQSLENWEVKAIVRNGECIGAAYFLDNEVHVSILPEWRRRWMTRGILKELFSRGKMRTRVTPGHEYMHGILNRLGFVQNDLGEFIKEH